jgi:hypothetical protein
VLDLLAGRDAYSQAPVFGCPLVSDDELVPKNGSQ